MVHLEPQIYLYILYSALVIFILGVTAVIAIIVGAFDEWYRL